MSAEPKPVISSNELKALSTIKPSLADAHASSVITHFMAHGALQAFVQDATVAIKTEHLKSRHPREMALSGVHAGVEASLMKLQAAARFYFMKLEPDFEYIIPSSLMSYLTRPGKGTMYDEGAEPSDLPVSITFIGQFIDHDLTKNATNLVSDESSVIVTDVASPFIDLDSVYGPRTDDDGSGGMVSPMSHGKFVLTKLDASNNAYDVQRDGSGGAMIEDGRNDENQLILQVHLLLMRVHNLLVKDLGMSKSQAQRETVFNWQSVVLNDHQESVLDATVRQHVLTDLENEVKHPGSVHRLKYRPSNKSLKMPHEFAIAFRYGHSQLRNGYFVGPNRSFPLFDNLDAGPAFKDLRGSRALTPDRAIDWPFFITPADDQRRSNLLDTHITSAVFDLPESAVPDTPTKFLGNLPQRNLIRSREIGLTSGEKLFDFYFGAHAEGKLTPDQVEPDASFQPLFHFAGGFHTPLWYYVLKEAELAGGKRLGKLGSRLVGEVVGGAVYYNPVAYVHEHSWKSVISHSRVVKMKDLVDFVTGKDAS
ncbi:hypothetical protein KZX46_21930 (plasmid) [Polymorphobacter sp. PAMC 29334]|uniref:peroxidase family protein n=1 Tax=Polymorphobacter sp. PAMC 29334 TaxID=2862331 RepID=UPI001C791D52|nr:peroxidase family protein [Polymorphobacter sp. PAMC 29334]QYE37061.1 hypothetical protein KZX46_21930 [Polymorphobacter sp. PAMC 29334]